MKRILNIENSRINKALSVTILLFLVISFSFAESRVIIEGNSSIIIESQTKETRLLVDYIETTTGGNFIDSNYTIKSKEVITANVEGSPKGFILEKAYPNPFNPTTNIKYGIDKNSDIEIKIFDMTGQLVSSSRINAQQPGWHEFTWNGTDASRKQVSAGIYLVTMRAGGNMKRQKVTYLK